MSMQSFTIRLAPADGVTVPPITGKADALSIEGAFFNVRDGLLTIRTEGDGFVSVQAGAIISFVSTPEPTLETLDMDAPVHTSDCAVHNAPALPAGPCDCGAEASPDASPDSAVDPSVVDHAPLLDPDIKKRITRLRDEWNYLARAGVTFHLRQRGVTAKKLASQITVCVPGEKERIPWLNLQLTEG